MRDALFRAYDNVEKKWVDDEWEVRHGWLLMDSNGDPVLIQDVEGEPDVCKVEVDWVDPYDLPERNMTFSERIEFFLVGSERNIKEEVE